MPDSSGTKVIVVTGAGSGIGAATAVRLASGNIHLILHTGSNLDGLSRVAEKCAEKGASTREVVGDLCDKETIESINEAVNARSALDVLVSNAGYPEWRPLGNLSAQGYQKAFEVTQLALFRLVSDNLDWIQKSPAGRIMAVSSFLAHRYELGGDHVPATAAAKAGLEAFVKSMAAQLALSATTVNAIVPGYIKKNSPDHIEQSPQGMRRILDRIPLDRLGKPDEVAGLIAFLASEDGAYITGQSIHIDGGLTL